jgi:TrpR-related protein YerC/YecD
MAKFSKIPKLTKEEREELIIRFCSAVSQIKNVAEAANFIQDIMSRQEAEMLAKRLKIAELLIAGNKYAEICSALKVSASTISRVYEWLKQSGAGYRLVLERMKKDTFLKEKKQKRVPDCWDSIKRKYPLYFWPQIVLDEIIKSAKEKDKNRLRMIIRKMDKKNALYKQLNQALLSGRSKESRIKR